MLFAALALALSAPANAALRHAVVVGSNRGSGGLEPLEYAEDDAGRFADVLVELGGFDPQEVTVLRGADRKAIENAIGEHAAIAAREPDDFFVFYYSGHADQNGLRIGGDTLSYADLKSDIGAMQSEFRLGILDACRSGEITRTKGMVLGDPFADVTDVRQVEGEAWLTAASEDEAAQESDKIRGSFFTHYLLSAMRGAADQGDGVVTLGEAYAYAYDRTVSRTGATTAGTQHPAHEFRITGRGDLPLTDVSQASARIVLPDDMQGIVTVLRLPDRTPLAEVAKTRGAPVRVGRPPGSYAVVLRDGKASAEATIGLTAGAERVVSGLQFDQVDVELASAKGGGGAGAVNIGGPLGDAIHQGHELLMDAFASIGATHDEPESAPAPTVHTNEWPGNAALVSACADRGEGCLRDALRNTPHPDGPLVGHNTDGTLAFSGKSEGGLATGYWTFYHPSGAVRCEGMAQSGVKKGNWTCRYESGAVESEVDYRADFESGTRTEFYANGKKRKKLDFDKGIASGRSVEWYENGKKKSEGHLSGGHPIGDWTSFFDTGVKQEQGKYDQYGKKGRWQSWYANGRKASDGHYERDARDGDWQLWWQSGGRKAEGRYEHGLEVGHWRTWHENGQRASEGRYKGGVRVGSWREWDPSGARLGHD
jgi:antitoxin component YwqK of YwqJK toxin-antitoxin module